MRADGHAIFYLVQHRSPASSVRHYRDEWSGSTDLGIILFDGLSFEERRGEPGDRFRALIEPSLASNDLYQRFGVHGFEYAGDAIAAMHACRDRRPDMEFRTVKRQVVQMTEVIA